MSDQDQPEATQKAGASLMRWVDAADGAGSSPRRLAESGGPTDYRHSEAGYPGNPGLCPMNSSPRLPRTAHRPHLAAPAAATEEAVAAIRLEPGYGGSGRHVELLKYCARVRVDAPQLAFGLDPGAMP